MGLRTAVQVFRAHEQLFEISTITVGRMTWFKGRKVAACLGFADAPQALRKNVDEEDKKTYMELMKGVVCATPPSNQQLQGDYVDSTYLSNQQPHEV